MNLATQADLEERYEHLTEQMLQRQQELEEFILEKTGEFSKANDGYTGSFQTSSIRKIDETHSFVRPGQDEKIRVMNQVLAQVADTDGYKQITEEINRLEQMLDEVWKQAAEVIINEDATKKANIGRLWAAFGEDAPNRRIAKAVGCHTGYPGRLTFDSETDTVEYKERVQRRKANQVRPDQRQEIVERDERACVRCGRAGEKVDLIVHHINPVNNDGTSDEGNLATLCSYCHDIAHDNSNKGHVIYDTPAEFWQWVRNGSRGFDPHQQSITDFDTQ